jgi:hypothetical protein
MSKKSRKYKIVTLSVGCLSEDVNQILTEFEQVGGQNGICCTALGSRCAEEEEIDEIMKQEENKNIPTPTE